MVHTPANKQPKPTIVAAPKGRNYKVTPMATTLLSRSAIRELAFEIYESRGREPGQDQQDWFRAEKEILERAK